VTFEQLIDSLNDEQRAAVRHGGAPPASRRLRAVARTRVVVARIAHLILNNNVPPNAILATTFSRSGAGEMNTRLAEIGIHGCRVGTIHSVSWEILRQDGPEFGGSYNVDERDLLHFALKEILRKEDIAVEVEAAEAFAAYAKANGVPMLPSVAAEFEFQAFELAQIWLQEEYGGGYEHGRKPSIHALVSAYRELEAARVRRGLITFDDMPLCAWLTLDRIPAARASWQGRYQHVIVDEAQDSTPRVARNATERDALTVFLDGKQRAWHRRKRGESSALETDIQRRWRRNGRTRWVRSSTVELETGRTGTRSTRNATAGGRWCRRTSRRRRRRGDSSTRWKPGSPPARSGSKPRAAR